MKLAKETKPYYITVVSHFQLSSRETDPQIAMTREFEEFDKKVNEKVEAGYKPYGSFIMEHCDTASMDLVQTMVLSTVD